MLVADALRSGAATKAGGGGMVPYPPWQIPENVRVELVEDARYPSDGPEAILEPAEYATPGA